MIRIHHEPFLVPNSSLYQPCLDGYVTPASLALCSVTVLQAFEIYYLLCSIPFIHCQFGYIDPFPFESFRFDLLMLVRAA